MSPTIFKVGGGCLLDVRVICVGKLKERHYIDASAEYIKRLGAYCKISVIEVPEVSLKKDPAPSEINAALSKEYNSMNITSGAVVVALCIEGGKLSSEGLAGEIQNFATRGMSKLTFLIGGSNGLSQDLKKRANLCLSMSDMTFPHHLARVMLLEQLYRAFNLLQGGRYHK